ncbi:MAG: hypothetical protein AAGE01_11120 [Pseudomonadota bacterium]
MIVGDLEVDLMARTVQRQGLILPVEGPSFELLACVLRHHPELAPMRAMEAAFVADGTSVSRQMQLLGEALAGSERYPNYLEMVAAEGYRLVAPVVPIAQDGRNRWRGPLVLASAVLGVLIFVLGLLSARP